MRLKRLELVGFKTFADATELLFDDGVTAVIGPNGSGKSNLADALLWVLAERRLSALRASEGSDVIFAGAEGRRPLSVAEVNLTIDNSDHKLPLELAEVCVTRRVHRNGENEYLLNHRKCRRKDIVDLFLDTGVGRESFTVISQREIDAILSIDATDRRRMIEEVAGIERYRSRRDETLRRLNDTTANLTRLSDLMLNLELQLEPLIEQKQVAEQYQRLRSEAEQLKLSLLVKDYELAAKRLARCDEELQSLAEAITTAKTGLATAEAAEERARLDLQRADEQSTVARQALGETAEALEQLQTKVRLGEERLTNLTDRLDEAGASLQRQEATLGALAGEAGDDQSERASIETRLTALRDEIASLEGQLRDAAANGAEQAAVQQRRAVSAVSDELARLRSARDAAVAQQDQAARRLRETSEKQTGSEAQRVERHDAVARAEAAVEQAQAELVRLREAEREDRAAVEALDQERTAVRDEAGDRQAELGELTARIEVMRTSAAQYEGFYAGVKAVCQARDRGRLRGDYAVVAELLEVAEDCDVAIEAALGARLQDLVCETAEDARAAIEFLKQGRAGRATFLPLDSIDTGRGVNDPGGLRRIPGVVGTALELVTTAPEYDRARRHLLSDVIVVEDLEAGIGVRRAGWNHATIVTLDGDLIRTRGSMSGGSRDNRGPNLLARRRELEEREQDLARRVAELAELRRREAALVDQRQTAAERGRAAVAALEAARQVQSEAERNRLAARSAAAQADSERSSLAALAGDYTTERDEAAADAERIAEELADAVARREQLVEALAAAEAEAERHRVVRTERSEALNVLRVEMARLESRLQGIEQRAARRDRELAAARAESERLERHRSEWLNLREQTTATLRAERQAWEEQRAAKEEQTSALTALQAMRRDASAGVEAAVKAARQAREDAATASEAYHRAELRKAQADGELSHLRETLAEDHGGLTPEQAARQATELSNRSEAAERWQELRDAMAAMGDVNLGAIDEYERISQQLVFYRKQQEDLEAARDDLLRVIAEIDEVTEVRLAEAFERVNEEFGKLFERVFGADGQASLSWTEPEKKLESGVEVLVRLPGKRTQNIMLLSGGERAMCTITLLLAMFRVKPSPFCLLDELDAPLDAENIRKYVALLREFGQQSQFIVITHNPETTRAADILYGITMPAPGVSRAYSHRPPADDEAADEASRAAD